MAAPNYLAEKCLALVGEMLAAARAALCLMRNPDFDPGELKELSARRRAQTAEVERLLERGAAEDMTVRQLLRLRAMADQLEALTEDMAEQAKRNGVALN